MALGTFALPHLPTGSIITGKISWFGGPNDSSAGSTTASGAPTSDPGIAVYDNQTLGGFWLIKTPNNDIGLVKQTDIGPAPWTGRKFDFTYSVIPMFGYTETDFPTNGTAKGYYVGKWDSSAGLGTRLSNGLAMLGASAEQSAVITQSVDSGAIEQGHSAVVAPSGQQSGTTLPGAGQTPSSSEAIAGGINIPGLGITLPPLGTIVKFIAAAVLLYLGLKELMGGTGVTVVNAARDAKTAKFAAGAA